MTTLVEEVRAPGPEVLDRDRPANSGRATGRSRSRRATYADGLATGVLAVWEAPSIGADGNR